jgi:hypothetical protein
MQQDSIQGNPGEIMASFYAKMCGLRIEVSVTVSRGPQRRM